MMFFSGIDCEIRVKNSIIIYGHRQFDGLLRNNGLKHRLGKNTRQS